MNRIIIVGIPIAVIVVIMLGIFLTVSFDELPQTEDESLPIGNNSEPKSYSSTLTESLRVSTP